MQHSINFSHAQIPNQLSSKELSPQALSVLMLLSTWGGEIYPSYKTLMQQLDIGRRQLMIALAEAEKAHLLKRKKTRHGRYEIGWLKDKTKWCGFVVMPCAFLKSPKWSKYEKALVYHLSVHETSYLSVQTMSQRYRMSRSTVHRCLRNLIQAGIVKSDRLSYRKCKYWVDKAVFYDSIKPKSMHGVIVSQRNLEPIMHTVIVSQRNLEPPSIASQRSLHSDSIKQLNSSATGEEFLTPQAIGSEAKQPETETEKQTFQDRMGLIKALLADTSPPQSTQGEEGNPLRGWKGTHHEPSRTIEQGSEHLVRLSRAQCLSKIEHPIFSPS